MVQKVWVELRGAYGDYTHLKAHTKCLKKCARVNCRKSSEHAQSGKYRQRVRSFATVFWRLLAKSQNFKAMSGRFGKALSSDMVL